jgi:large subunit ribosomal protein L5
MGATDPMGNNPAEPRGEAGPEVEAQKQAVPEAQAAGDAQVASEAPAAAAAQSGEQAGAEVRPKVDERPKDQGKPRGGAKAKGEAKGKGDAKAERQAKGKDRTPPPKPRLLTRFQQEVVPALKEALGTNNQMAVPRVSKIVLSMGLGKAVQEGGAKSIETKRFQDAVNQMAAVGGQKPVVTRARKSVSQFKVREGWPVGLKVTLRGARMWEFLDRLINLAIPRIRDFRGLDPKGFDGGGNYNMGVTEQSVFPEIDAGQITYQQGMNVTICTTGKNATEAFELLRRMGMPFRV